MYNVYQHWDPLKVCAVGRSYAPEFYSWIKVPHVRNLFERIAAETEEDFQNIIKKLQEFDVEILRPRCLQVEVDGLASIPTPPMTPRDSMVMIGDRFYYNRLGAFDWSIFYKRVKDPSWETYPTLNDFLHGASSWQIDEVMTQHGLAAVLQSMENSFDPYQSIVDHVQQQGNRIYDASNIGLPINGAMVTRIGKDLYFGTLDHSSDVSEIKARADREFPDRRNHVINTGGHSDSTFCPVCPGLIISLFDVPTYAETFPGWEVVYLPNQSWSAVKPFLDLKEKNHGRWWIPGFEYDPDVINTVETWLSHWVGYVEETVFDVNMLIIDPKNVMVFNENDQVFRALDKHGITPHVVPFRHRYFWDGGIHCVTLDLDRCGTLTDFFSNRP